MSEAVLLELIKLVTPTVTSIVALIIALRTAAAVQDRRRDRRAGDAPKDDQ